MTPDPLTTKSGAEIFAETLVGLVGALAWPALIAYALFHFSEPLKNLVSRIQSASVAGNIFKFRDELREVSKQINEEVADIQPDNNPDTDGTLNPGTNNDTTRNNQNGDGPLVISADVINNLFSIASLSPASAIVESFKYVEHEWSALLESKGVISKTRRSYKDFAGAVGLPSEIISNIDRLRQLRNNAAHSSNLYLTPADASEYVNSAFLVATLLRDVRLKSDTETSK